MPYTLPSGAPYKVYDPLPVTFTQTGAVKLLLTVKVNDGFTTRTIAEGVAYDLTDDTVVFNVAPILRDFLLSNIHLNSAIPLSNRANGYASQLGQSFELSGEYGTLDGNGLIEWTNVTATSWAKFYLAGTAIGTSLIAPGILTTYTGQRTAAPGDRVSMCFLDNITLVQATQTDSNGANIGLPDTMDIQAVDTYRPVRYCAIGPSVFSSLSPLAAGVSIFFGVTQRLTYRLVRNCSSKDSIRLHWVNRFGGMESERFIVPSGVVYTRVSEKTQYSYSKAITSYNPFTARMFQAIRRGGTRVSFTVLEADLDRCHWLAEIVLSGVIWVEDAGRLLPGVIVSDVSYGGQVPWQMGMEILLPDEIID